MEVPKKLVECHSLIKREISLGRKDEIVLAAILKDFENYMHLCMQGIAHNRDKQLLGPLKYLLKTDSKPDLKIKVIECLEVLFEKTSIANDFTIDEFVELTSLIFINIYEPSSSGVKLDASEELKSAVLKFGALLVMNISKYSDKLYNVELAGKISLPILVSVQIAEKEKNIHLRLEAFSYLLCISQYGASSSILGKVADVFQKFLPGVVKPLQDILSRDETQHHMITVKALTCWGHIIYLVMHDYKDTNEESVGDLIRSWTNFKLKDTINMNSLKDTTRSKDWTKAAAFMLKPLLIKTSLLRKHSNSKVRLELVKVAAKLVQNCVINLKEVVTPMIEVLIGSLEDQDSKVRSAAEAAVFDFREACEKLDANLFIDLMEDNYYNLIIELPRIIHSRDEKVTHSAVTLLSQYLRILGESNKLSQVLNSPDHLKKITTVLSICAEFELPQEVTEKELTDGIPYKTYKVFKHFTDQAIAKKVEYISRLLALHGDVETVIDYLAENYRKKSGFRKETLYILNEVVSGAKQIETNIVNQMLEIYLDPENLYLPLEVQKDDFLTIKEARSNIIEVMLLMEGIGKLATSVGSSFQDYILRTLYYVVEKIGNSYCAIRKVASISGQQISEACGYGGGIPELIQGNIDYLTYHLTMKLKRAESNAGVFDVVGVVMTNSPMNAISNLEEIVDNVLKSSAERFESPNTMAYLRLFRTFTTCVIKWMNPVRRKKDEPLKPEEDISDIWDKLEQYILQKEKEKRAAEDFDEEWNEDEPQEEEEEVEKKKPLPKHLTMSLAIGRHCLNFLPSKDRDKKIIVLEILNDCVQITAEYEDELLPFVHEIWSPLVTRFDKIVDPLTISRSFTLLCTLCDTARDFIRSRTLKQVMPTLTTFLKKSAQESRLKDSGSGYFFTQTFKLQKTLLSSLGKLAIDLRLFEKQMDEVFNSALPYLNKKQPKALQENAAKLVSELESHDPYLVWLYLGTSNRPQALAVYKKMCGELNFDSFVVKSSEKEIQDDTSDT